MIKTILVPTDFSNNARVAAQYALGLAKELGVGIHVIHAYQPFTSAFQSPLANETDENRAKREAEQGMADFLESIDEVPAGGLSYSIVKRGLVTSIEEYHKGNAETLVIMGTHGASGTRKDILGSNTYDVTKTISVPIVVVPEHTETSSISHIAFFTDYHQNDVHTLKGFHGVLGNKDVHCTLIHILNEQGNPSASDTRRLEDWRVKLAEETGFGQLSARFVQGKENVDTVNDTIKQFNADLVLLTLIGGRGFFERLLHKSLARSIIINPHTPVFLFTKEVG